MATTKKEAFQNEMISISQKAKKECNYNPSRFLVMVERDGGWETAKKLVNNKDLSDGFISLWEADRLDLTVEALIMRDEWQDLFSADDIRNAKKKLSDCGYKF
jgi:hypothetical protein